MANSFYTCTGQVYLLLNLGKLELLLNLGKLELQITINLNDHLLPHEQI